MELGVEVFKPRCCESAELLMEVKVIPESLIKGCWSSVENDEDSKSVLVEDKRRVAESLLRTSSEIEESDETIGDR